MTLIVSLFSHKNIIQMSDRRTTYPNGAVAKDEYNKAIMISTSDKSCIMGFTGIAHVNNFLTTAWIAESLKECASPDFLLDSILDRFCVRAKKYFLESVELKNISDDVKSLAIGFSGYLLSDPVEPFYTVVRNFVDKNDPMEFRRQTCSPNGNNELTFGCGVILGQTNLVTDKDLEPVFDMLKKETPYDGISDKMVEIFNQAMSKGKGGQTIGPQITSVTLASDKVGGFKINSFTGTPKTEIPIPTWLHLTSKDTSHCDFSVVPEGPENEIKHVPKVRKNSPCPCGSRKKYRHCHGRMTGEKIAHRVALENGKNGKS